VAVLALSNNGLYRPENASARLRTPSSRHAILLPKLVNWANSA